jgi:hypothetical protein
MPVGERSELLRPEQGVQQIGQQHRRHEEKDEGGRAHDGDLQPRGDARVGVRGGEADEDEHDRSDIAHGMLRVERVSCGT